MTRKKLTHKNLRDNIDNLSEVSEDEFSETDSLNDPAYIPELEDEDANMENLEKNIEEESVEMNCNQEEEIEKEVEVEKSLCLVSQSNAIKRGRSSSSTVEDMLVSKKQKAQHCTYPLGTYDLIKLGTLKHRVIETLCENSA
ncbi:hypothetical protein HHI36_003364 [Cryptolaemus montrouzieri]|uniref:Uncharacterized protein n=1 Tax=Cryptolaemus montrouzieri TaxID=559131 RepID=A0ABD2PD66_9CUCU